ncbi:mannonate dehydratase [Roseomonas sp. CCTCC AB2023176]|uniref:mannonate dehydratase n=1 Tax=Roseomonas sp. CCTCC AB2023176 TaxID=3342640 RepID=UPI0035DB62D3
MRLAMLLPPHPDRRWDLALQMGVSAAITKCAPELTGEAPPYEAGVLECAQRRFAAAGFDLIGLEGDQFDLSRIKLGLPGAEDDLAHYAAMIEEAGRLGITLICQNFMAGVGWFRTESNGEGRGGARVSRFSAADAARLTPVVAEAVPQETIWENLTRFLRAAVPVAERAGVTIALHPDDPPVSSLRGVGRVLTSAAALEQACGIVPSPALGITFCAGSLAAAGEDVVGLVPRLAPHIRFIHVRDLRRTADGFEETFPDEGGTDMPALFRAYAAAGLDVPIRPDHAPTMAGDQAGVLPATGGGISVGYEATGMVYTVGWMRGLMRCHGLG